MEGTVYRYGAGKPPPLLAGRGALIRAWERMLNEVAIEGRGAAQDYLFTGVRGVGKTCLVTTLTGRAADEQNGYELIDLQAIEDRATLVDSLLRQADAAIEEDRNGWARAKAALERFAGFELGVGGVANIGFNTHDRHTEPSERRDPESLAEALAEVALASKASSKAGSGGLVLAVDELQVADPGEVRLLAAALQKLNKGTHQTAPVVFVATGLPYTMNYLAKIGVTHPDRLFVDRGIPIRLEPDDAYAAVVEPARSRGVTWDPRAAQAVLEAANYYPAHLQFFAQAVWEVASGNRIEPADAQNAIPPAIEELTHRTLDSRWDRLTDRQAELLSAIAAHGGRASVRELETTLGRGNKQWSPYRDELIESGELYAPRRGELEIAMPAMAPYALLHYRDVQTASRYELVPAGDLEQLARTRTGSSDTSRLASDNQRPAILPSAQQPRPASPASPPDIPNTGPTP